MSTKPHDALFRATFTQLEHARATLAVLLPAAVSRHIDWTSLRLLPGSFITDDLKERVTDLLYSVRLRGGGELLLHLLFEHQSEVDVFMALRLLEYMVDIWTTMRREHPELQSLPPILPVVIHHSDTGWTASTHFEDLLDLSPEARVDLAPYMPHFGFVLEDLSQRDDEALHGMATTALARLAFFCMRDARRGQAFFDHMPAWADLYHEVCSAQNGVEAAAAVMRYIHLVTEIPQPQMERWLLEALGPEAKETFVTLGEKLIEQGRQEGLQKGLQRGLQRGREEALRRVVEKQLTLKFGALDEAQRGRLQATDAAQLEEMSERILTAASVEDVLR